MARIASPFNVGDTVKFCDEGSGYPKGKTAKVLAVGYDENSGVRGKSAWRVKIDIAPRWWSAAWFVKVKNIR